MDFNYDYYNDMTPSSVDGTVITTILAVLGVWILLVLGIAIFMFITNWRIYKKAGREGWESIVPIYNLIVKFQFLNIPIWFIILLFIPGANVAIPIVTAINMAKKFGKDTGFTIGLICAPVIFYPILAFGKAEYNSSIKGIFEDGAESNASNNSNTRYCTYCGAPVTGKYCTKCGKETQI